MMCSTHLDREVQTAGDLLNPVQQGISSYSQTPRNKRKGSGRASKTTIKISFTSESATNQGTLSQQQEANKDSGDKYTKEDRNNQQ